MSTNNARTSSQDVVHTADIVRHGDKIVIPASMEYPVAIEIIERMMEDEDELIAFDEAIDCFPWEGAIAFKKALDMTFGFSGTIATPSWFGPIPPKEIAVETGIDTKVMVPWGRFTFALGTKEEYLQAGTTEKDGRVIFAVRGVIKKKWKSTIAELATLTREIFRKESIYRGKAVRINFTDDDNVVEQIPTPKFIDLRGVDLGEMVYTEELTRLIETNVMTPLRHTAAVRASKIPLKRGVLLAGPYGTGKSLLARAVAKVGTDNNWTFIYIKDAGELPHAIKFAVQYQPAVIFAEDVDRHVTGGRTAAMDQILNTLDGIDTKSSELMVVLTTNHLEQINKAMLRPGRLDVILNVVPPDAEAVERLVRVYARGKIDESTDLTRVGELMAGYTPAIIREVVERAKLATITRTGTADADIAGVDIETSAATMVQQQTLLADKPVEQASWADGMVRDVAGAVTGAVLAHELTKNQLKQVKEIHTSVV